MTRNSEDYKIWVELETQDIEEEIRELIKQLDVLIYIDEWEKKHLNN